VVVGLVGKVVTQVNQVEVVPEARTLVNVGMRIVKLAFIMAVALLEPLISLAQVRDLVKKALVKVRLEVLLAKIGGLAVNQPVNLVKSLQKADQ
jgi:hypothetical protein